MLHNLSTNAQRFLINDMDKDTCALPFCICASKGIGAFCGQFVEGHGREVCVVDLRKVFDLQNPITQFSMKEERVNTLDLSSRRYRYSSIVSLDFSDDGNWVSLVSFPFLAFPCKDIELVLVL